MNVTDTTRLDMLTARIRIPSGGTRMFVAGRAQSGSPVDDDELNSPVSGEEIREILRANRGAMRPADIAGLMNADVKSVSQSLRIMAKRGVVDQRRAPRGPGCVYELRQV